MKVYWTQEKMQAQYNRNYWKVLNGPQDGDPSTSFGWGPTVLGVQIEGVSRCCTAGQKKCMPKCMGLKILAHKELMNWEGAMDHKGGLDRKLGSWRERSIMKEKPPTKNPIRRSQSGALTTLIITITAFSQFFNFFASRLRPRATSRAHLRILEHRSIRVDSNLTVDSHFIEFNSFARSLASYD